MKREYWNYLYFKDEQKSCELSKSFIVWWTGPFEKEIMRKLEIKLHKLGLKQVKIINNKSHFHSTVSSERNTEGKKSKLKISFI